MFLKDEIIKHYPLLVQEHQKSQNLNKDAFAKQIESKRLNYDADFREKLKEVLLEQYASINKSKKVSKNIEALANKDTFTVCTGHQLCLFGGPAYVAYKILQTIKLASELSKRQNIQVVPVLWLANEDHDFEEISFLRIYKEGIKWNGAYTDQSVGNLNSNELKPLIHAFE